MHNISTRTGNRNVHCTVHFTAVVAQTQGAKPDTRVQRGCVADRHVTLTERQPFTRIPVPSCDPLRVTGHRTDRYRHRDCSAVWVPQPAIVDLWMYTALHMKRVAFGHHHRPSGRHREWRYTCRVQNDPEILYIIWNRILYDA